MERKHIRASEGMMFTNGEIYAHEIDLGDWDSAENYHEIPATEYERRMAEDEQRI